MHKALLSQTHCFTGGGQGDCEARGARPAGLHLRTGDSFRDWGVLHRTICGLACRTCGRNKKRCAHTAALEEVSGGKLCNAVTGLPVRNGRGMRPVVVQSPLHALVNRDTQQRAHMRCVHAGMRQQVRMTADAFERKLKAEFDGGRAEAAEVHLPAATSQHQA